MSVKENALFRTYRKKGHPQNSEQGQGWEETMVSDTLNIFDNSETRTPTLVLENHPADSRVKVSEDGIVQTLSSRMGTGGGNVPMVMETVAIESHPKDSRYRIVTPKTNQTIPSIMCHDAAHGGLIMQTVVRRLTPLECERLQGYPDGWTDIGEWIDSKGKKHKDADSPRYKALGNSIALPFWQWMADRMVKQLKADGVKNPTMASLFDGIGGFPLVFSRCGCDPVWASEIEEFPIAVTKIRFKENNT